MIPPLVRVGGLHMAIIAGILHLKVTVVLMSARLIWATTPQLILFWEQVVPMQTVKMLSMSCSVTQ